MRERCCALILLLFCAVATVGGSHLKALKFTTIHVPGARVTEATGLNRQGDIVGVWEDAATGRAHGFLLRAGVYTSLTVPGARLTIPRAINDAGVIVGAYDVEPQAGEVCCASHGFVRTPDGVFTTVTFASTGDLPSTWLSGINNHGQIVGGYSEFDTSIFDTRGVFGFLLSEGVFTPIDFPVSPPFPGTPVTYASGINDAGEIVGGYNDVETRRGYILRNGVFETFDVPGAALTDLFAINDAGEMVGEYINGGALVSFFFSPRRGLHAITLSGKDKRQISSLLATDLNAAGQMVGTFTATLVSGSLRADGRTGLSRLTGFAPRGRRQGQDGQGATEVLALRGFLASPPSVR